ncbi:hypothetical protein O0L34_g10402 [Tuta absoluta]|nr:hypothetical protein O0L34_g10402 [Tuta absoluta]
MYNMRDMLYVSSQRKSLTKYTIYGVCIFLAATICFSPQVLINRSQIAYERPQKFPTDMKYILIWKAPKTMSSKNLENHFISPMKQTLFAKGQNLFVKQKCSYINCFITYDKNLLNHEWYFDAVVFDVHEIKHQKINSLNWTRALYQKYIFRSMESSETHYICHKSYDNFFNWTWTYRLDSDIPHPFLDVFDLNNNKIGPRENMKWITDMKRVDRFGGKVKHKEKAVAWIINSCKTKKRHEDFYETFKKELESWNYTLDTYGTCGQNPCPSGALYKCYKMIEKKYFFQMVTEDSMDEDYVTEKLVKVLQIVVIPIVVGGANYSRFLPPGTYLDSQAFDMKKLGAIINYLIQNKPTYTYFFDWKNHYAYNIRPRNYVCDLCAKLNEKSDSSESIKHFRRWWNPNYEDLCLRKRLYFKFAKNSQSESKS